MTLTASVLSDTTTRKCHRMYSQLQVSHGIHGNLHFAQKSFRQAIISCNSEDLSVYTVMQAFWQFPKFRQFEYNTISRNVKHVGMVCQGVKCEFLLV